jgi:endoglucanase
MRGESFKFLADLIRTPSPSGAEQAVAQLYRNYVSAHVDRIEGDVHGNVIASINPDAPMKVMIAGHMDEIAFTIRHINEDGLLFFGTIGGHDAPVPVGQMVWVHGKERLAGAVGRKAIHLLAPDEKTRTPQFHELWVDIGATSREEAAEVVSLGDAVTYQYELCRLLGHRVAARAFDNKAGLFIVAETLRLLGTEGGLDPAVGVFGLGTVQEEVGSRGAQTATFEIDPQSAIAVDMDQALDYPGISKLEHGSMDVGKGPSISRGPNTNPIVFELLLAAAKQEGIPHQIQVAGRPTPTDAKAMQVSGKARAAGLVGVPLRYMHTPCEVLDMRDVEKCVQLLATYCRSLRADTSFMPRA